MNEIRRQYRVVRCQNAEATYVDEAQPPSLAGPSDQILASRVDEGSSDNSPTW